MEQYPLWNGGSWERPQTVPPAIPILRERKVRRKRPVSREKRRGLKILVLFLSTITLLTVAAACITRFGLPSALAALLPQPGANDSGFDFFFGEGEEGEKEDPVQDQPTTIRRAGAGGTARMELAAKEGEVLSPKEIYDKNLPSIVFIQARCGNMISSGTGVILSEDGYIITNEHVISGASSVTVIFSDDSRLSALLVGYYAKMDLAVLKVQANGLIPAEFGDSDQMQVGDTVVAIGNPLGSTLRGTMTSGIVSAVNRPIQVDGETMTLIQTDAPLNPGNSGGALINDRGQVIGITTLKMVSEEDTIEGLGFAIPTRESKPIVDQLVDKGAVLVLGITVDTRVEENGGLLVLEVDQNSDAWANGLRPGDVIVAVNGETVASVDTLSALKAELRLGEAILFTIQRGQQQLQVRAALMDDDLL